MGLDTKDKKRLRVQLVDNPLKNDGEEKVFKLITSGTADLNRIINEIMSYNPGFEREMVEAVLKLEQRAVLNLTLNGMRVNNGLFSAVASPKGRGSATWNRDINRLDIRLTQGALWRDSVRNTSVCLFWGLNQTQCTLAMSRIWIMECRLWPEISLLSQGVI